MTLSTAKNKSQKCQTRKPGRKSTRRKTLQKQRRSTSRAQKSSQRQRVRGLDERLLLKVSTSIFGKILHHKQVLSIALVTLGVIYTARMTVHAIGASMAKSRGHGSTKHGIKQVDRFMSNRKLKQVEMREGLVRAVVGNRKAIDVSMDWTDFDNDNQTTLALSLIMRHGRAIPLVWHTVKKSELKNKQTQHEHTAVQMLRDALPKGVHVTLIADRGFGNTIFFDHLLDLPGFSFIIRFRQGFYLTDDSFCGKAEGAVYKNGRIRVFQKAKLTGQKKGPYTVVLYKAKKMKDAWCLATNVETVDGRNIVHKYGRRFECEEGFRDLKDWRFGLGLKHTSIKNEGRRERLLFAFALAAYLLTLVGIESEALGCDRLLRANTSKKRTHSLFRQGREIVAGALPCELEALCLRAVRDSVAAALKRGFCHAMS